MVEVLVSVLVLAMGVLGAAGMQLAAMRATQESWYHTTALQLAAEVSEAIAAAGGLAPGMADALMDLDLETRPGAPTDTGGVRCHFSTCPSQDFIQSLAAEWQSRLQAAFPAARLRICRGSAGEDGQPLRWECGGSGDAPLVVKLGWQARHPDGRLARDAAGSFAPAVVLTVPGV